MWLHSMHAPSLNGRESVRPMKQPCQYGVSARTPSSRASQCAPPSARAFSYAPQVRFTHVGVDTHIRTPPPLAALEVPGSVQVLGAQLDMAPLQALARSFNTGMWRCESRAESGGLGGQCGASPWRPWRCQAAGKCLGGRLDLALVQMLVQAFYTPSPKHNAPLPPQAWRARTAW